MPSIKTELHFILYGDTLLFNKPLVTNIGMNALRTWVGRPSNLYHGNPYTDRLASLHDDVIKWNHFPRYWPFERGIHRSPVNSPHKGQWRGALMFSLVCVWIYGCVNNREAGYLGRHRAHYGVIVMILREDPDFIEFCYHLYYYIRHSCLYCPWPLLVWFSWWKKYFT